MISNAEKNYYINIPLTIIGFACLISGFLIDDRSISFGGVNIRSLHIWTGYIMTGLIGVHLLMHVKWIKNISAGIFKNKFKVISLVTTVFVSLGICYATGIIGPNGNEQRHIRGGQGQYQNMDRFDQNQSDFESQ